MRVLTPLLKKAGLPHLTWHHLRHNAGSYLLRVWMLNHHPQIFIYDVHTYLLS